MSNQTLTPPEEKITLSGISWQTYETLLKELCVRVAWALPIRRLRLTYNRGTLKIMSPSPEREIYKRVLGRFLETIAEELNVNIYPLGSTTFQRPQLK
jgi:Uma2 family endonuclease